MALDRNFWESRYHEGDTGWDLGGPSTPLKTYIDQLTDKGLRILIPGAGRAYEAEYLHRQGFANVFVIDLTDAPYADLLKRCPDFPKENLLVGDLFTHAGQYDRILEQTCFCAIDPSLRSAYVKQMHALLAPGGKYVGVLFDDLRPGKDPNGPPYGGSRAEYETLFTPPFQAVTFEACYNSIAPRAGREFWVNAPRS